MKQSRNTQAKKEILNIFQLSTQAISHSELQNQLNGLCDRVTIYRVLDRLLNEGIIHKLSTIDGEVKYALCHTCSGGEHFHNHLHFNCEVCHSVTCLEEVVPVFYLPETYKIKQVNFTVSGVCPKCSK